ncbi:MAG: arylamine N-acetyltransferase [Pseudomonadota bacterium]
MAEISYSDVARDFLKLVGLPPAKPDHAFLCKLTRAFNRLPYENLTKVIRATKTADPEKRLRTPDVILEEHIDMGAGGTCFSLTYFFQQVLFFAGYDSWPVFCDRSYGPDTHCAIIVPLSNMRFLVDPGYLMEEPLVIPTFGDSVQHSPTGMLRLMRLGTSKQLLLITERKGKTRIRYRLRDEPVSAIHFRSRWIDSFEWAMMRHLCVSRQTGTGQLFMRDGVVRFTDKTKRAQDRIGRNFSREIEKAFGIDMRIVSAAQDALKSRGA